MRDTAIPDRFPVLSRGKHRSPRRGACFMELASFLAGERWSDHPACTHPLLAAVARAVNDATSDGQRGRLAVLIPSVIGTSTDDPHADVAIALHCARTALPVAPMEKQRVLAVGILAGERALASLDGRPADTMTSESTKALACAPQAAAWAQRFSRGEQPTPPQFARRAAPTIVATAVRGVTQACAGDTDDVLYEILRGAIDACRTVARPDAVPADDPAPALARLRELAG